MEEDDRILLRNDYEKLKNMRSEPEKNIKGKKKEFSAQV